ncbi:MAG TPA: SdiA-regulated domain-containing protein [Sulfurovum sp.]|jgi:uncharacterized protein YjiK|nr:MAG: hypothetical protein B7Y63_06190 [Sulfurovum sp. 35-42-20]OYY56291.1 MAG: hypothetical protein B7Y52_03760 [Sulfurovum sp. 28-43-6]OYZ25308.1 MAG: hypothetical protein B7Y23_06115 [Sulfurovum sp. 16-42-52]OYZ48487.1 MAG: hypothetical protein B7Y13_07450 [Sulfurovum sp. 24-42-9]OZA44182.1 MAG: hypothetical protein B7X80_08270 [Sulfurovum sp. 17-42-90]OZA60624.1 MAG: hypothetical protein B7X69_03065 [Sulfurovum sp. 39-42-12]HQR74634.1 SdiA-regulated domain-containing protein [Sulfurovum
MKKIVWGCMAILLFGCSERSGQTLVKIPEASGIDYCSDSDTLIVANDEGRYYEIDKQGKILHQTTVGQYDLEGVVCEKESLLFAVENKGLLRVDRKTGKSEEVKIAQKYQGKSLGIFAKKAGVEGIAKAGDTLYLAKQSKKKKDSFIAVVELTVGTSAVVDVIEHHLADTAGLTLHEGYLYMVSDKEDVLMVYHIRKKKMVQKVKLGEGAWEGVAFDNKGDVYLADDDGRVVKQTKKALGL